MYHRFLIHSSADGHLGFFHVLAIINTRRRRQKKDHEKILEEIIVENFPKMRKRGNIHNGIFLSYKKNILESVLMRWMKLEPIIQSKVSQKEKYQYSILTHIYGI